MELLTESAGKRWTKTGRILAAGTEIETQVRCAWNGKAWIFRRGKISHFDQRAKAYCVVFMYRYNALDVVEKTLITPEDLWPVKSSERETMWD